MRKIHIGELVVHRGEPTTNVRIGLIGDERKWALRQFKSELHSAFTFWHVPYTGPVRQVTDPSDVDWESSGV